MEQLTLFENSLIECEMNLKGSLKKTHAYMETNFKEVYANLESILTGESGIKLMEEYINEFFTKF